MSSARDYSAGERGGGSGATGRRRAAILAQVNNWFDGTRWADPERAEAIQTKFNETPEKFISPDPDTDYREEASRIYHGLKDEYGLRTVDAAAREYRDLEAAADEHYAEQTGFDETNELGGAPEPNEHNPSAPGAGETPERPTVSVGRPTAPEPSPVAAAEQASLSDVTPTRPTPAVGPARRPRRRSSRTLRTIARLPGPIRALAVAAYVALRWSPDRRQGAIGT